MKKRFSNSTEVYWGKEADPKSYPDSYSDNFKVFLGEQFAWYNFSSTNEKKKNWFLSWVMENRPEVNLDPIKEVNDGAFTTAGVIARLLSRGLNVSDYLLSKMDRWIDRFTEVGNETIAIKNKNKASKKSNVDFRLKELISSIDFEIDTFIENGYTTSFNMKDWLEQNTPSSSHLSVIQSKYSVLLEEISSTDKDLVEAYSHLNEDQMMAFMELIIDIVSTNIVRQKVSKPRRKKQVTPEKQTAKLKFAEGDDAIGVISIKPKAVPGSKVLWVWNKKYRMLGAYYVQEGKEFVVKGTTILNFDPNTSVAKKIRKPEIVPSFLEMSKVSTKKALVEIKSKEIKMNGRINSDTVLLKVY
jgi:hypothetical protein